jgi:hypothetical protein
MSYFPPEDDGRNSLFERWWVGLAALVLLAVAVVFGLKGCAYGAEVKLAWNANPASEQVEGYRLYRLGSPNVLLATVPTPSATVDVPVGALVAVSAYNTAGESALSEPVLVPLPLPKVKLTIQQSDDLKNWEDVQTIEVPKQEKQFFRIKINP